MPVKTLTPEELISLYTEDPRRRDVICRLLSFLNLENNWDAEGAMKPTPEAVQEAIRIVDWAYSNHLKVADVDPDGLGGVAVRLEGTADRKAWMACMNSGTLTASLEQGPNYKGTFAAPYPSDRSHLFTNVLAHFQETTPEALKPPSEKLLKPGDLPLVLSSGFCGGVMGAGFPSRGSLLLGIVGCLFCVLACLIALHLGRSEEED